MAEPPRTQQVLKELAVLGALAYNWLSTSHADQLGHDHHCTLSGMDPAQPELCTCGWSTFYAQYLKLEAGPTPRMPDV